MVVAPLPRRRRGALFPAETDAAAPPQRRVRVEHDQKVRDLRAQLEAERRAHRADGRRRRPAAPREARHDQARAEPRGEGEARLRDAQKGLRANRAASPFSAAPAEASGERPRRHVVELLSRRWRGGHAWFMRRKRARPRARASTSLRGPVVGLSSIFARMRWACV